MATKPPDLRKLKDQATKALEKKSYAKAAELYLEIAEHEEDPDWRQRAGEALRKAGKNPEAVTQLTKAAEGYAHEGFLLKAIAVCKVVLQLDPQHTETQAMLATLFAQREGKPLRVESLPSARAPVPAAPAVAPPVTPRAVAARVRPDVADGPPSIAGPPGLPDVIPLSLDSPEPVALDAGRKRQTVPPGAPMDVVPLASVLGGRRSQQFTAVKASDYGIQLDGGVYEIDLDSPAPAPALDPAMLLATDVRAPRQNLEPLPTTGPHRVVEMTAEPTLSGRSPLAAPPPIPTAPPADELDFSSVVPDPIAAPAPIPVAAPADELDFSSVVPDPIAAPPPIPVAPPADELDFSAVMDPAAPLPAGVHITPRAPAAKAPEPAPVPVAAPAPIPVAAPADELDFSMVMDDAKPLPAGVHIAPPAAPAPVAPPAVAPAPALPSLPKIPLFSSLDQAELRAFIEGVEVREFDAGDAILKQGESGVALYVIVRGQVEVLLEGPPQREIATLGEGAFFGELALLTDFPRSATVVAQVDTQCLEISRELAARVIADSPEVLKTMLRFFRDRMLDRFLNSADLFTRFNADDARQLMARFKFVEVEPRARLVEEGKRAGGLFLLLCGEAQVVQGSVSIAKLVPGDVFGEMSMLTRSPAMASIDTVTKCWALQLPSSEFQEIALTYPQFLEFVSTLADKRRVTNLQAP